MLLLVIDRRPEAAEQVIEVTYALPGAHSRPGYGQPRVRRNVVALLPHLAASEEA